MLRGLPNVNLVADDMRAAIDWYSELLGARPYFVMPPEGEPEYAEWRFGDDEDELALMASSYRPALETPGGAVVSMHVDDIEAALARLEEPGRRSCSRSWSAARGSRTRPSRIRSGTCSASSAARTGPRGTSGTGRHQRDGSARWIRAVPSPRGITPGARVRGSRPEPAARASVGRCGRAARASEPRSG